MLPCGRPRQAYNVSFWYGTLIARKFIAVQWLLFGRCFSSDDAGDGPEQSGLVRVSKLHGAFINCRGRCGGKAAMQALHRALYDIDSRASIVAVAEADFRRKEGEETYDFTYYKKCWHVVRKRLHNGRAFKIFIAKELQDCISSIVCLQRRVVVRIRSSLDCV